MPIAALRNGMISKEAGHVTPIAFGFVSVAIIGFNAMNGRLVIGIQRNWMSGFIQGMIIGERGKGITSQRRKMLSYRSQSCPRNLRAFAGCARFIVSVLVSVNVMFIYSSLRFHLNGGFDQKLKKFSISRASNTSLVLIVPVSPGFGM